MNYVIVGLGNPGEEYEKTRHNTGFIVLELLRKQFEGSVWKEDKKLRALVSKISPATSGTKHGAQLVLPQTFMNNSGGSVKPLIAGLTKEATEKNAAKLIVVHDDLDQPLGAVKAVFNRGSGGHRGIESITKALKTEAYMKIKVGISPSTAGGKIRKPLGVELVEKCILGEFKSTEMEKLKPVFKKIKEGIEVLLNEDKDAAIQVINTQ